VPDFFQKFVALEVCAPIKENNGIFELHVHKLFIVPRGGERYALAYC
jgi:hypothetical protein